MTRAMPIAEQGADIGAITDEQLLKRYIEKSVREVVDNIMAVDNPRKIRTLFGDGACTVYDGQTTDRILNLPAVADNILETLGKCCGKKLVGIDDYILIKLATEKKLATSAGIEIVERILNNYL